MTNLNNMNDRQEDKQFMNVKLKTEKPKLPDQYPPGLARLITIEVNE